MGGAGVVVVVEEVAQLSAGAADPILVADGDAGEFAVAASARH